MDTVMVKLESSVGEKLLTGIFPLVYKKKQFYNFHRISNYSSTVAPHIPMS